MKRLLWMVPTLVLSVAFAGCSGQRKAPVPAGKFKVTLLSKISNGDVLVRHYRIEAAGSHTVKVTEGKGNLESVLMDPVAGSQSAKADLYFVATLSSVGKTGSVLKWLVKIENSGGGSAGGPDTWSMKEVKGLDKILQVDLPEGEHPLGTPIALGHLQKNEIVLTVK